MWVMWVRVSSTGWAWMALIEGPVTQAWCLGSDQSIICFSRCCMLATFCFLHHYDKRKMPEKNNIEEKRFRVVESEAFSSIDLGLKGAVTHSRGSCSPSAVRTDRWTEGVPPPNNAIRAWVHQWVCSLPRRGSSVQSCTQNSASHHYSQDQATNT